MNKSTEKPTIFIIDDDKSICRSLSLLLSSEGYDVRAFCDTSEIMINEEFDGPGCILLDVFLGKKSALEIQAEINRQFSHLPIVFMSGRGNIPISVQAMKQGAIDFLQKPIEADTLFKAVDEAIVLSCDLRIKQKEELDIASKIELLTPREREIYFLLITGILNKQIAAKLNIAEHTVKLHRGHITTKLGVKSVAEMVQMSEKVKNHTFN